MEFIKSALSFFRKRRSAKADVQYYDNYTLFGSIMGGYCGLLKFNGPQR